MAKFLKQSPFMFLMKNKQNEPVYYIMKYNDRVLFISKDTGGRKGDTCGSPEELVDKCMNFKVPVESISTSPPDEDTLAKIMKGYPLLKLEPVELEPDLVARIKGL